MSDPFSPTQVSFDGYGRDNQGALWARFRTDIPGNRFFHIPTTDLNTGGFELWRKLSHFGIMLDHADKNKILQKLKVFTRTRRRLTFKVVHTLGWSTLGYVTPTRVFGAPSCLIERDLPDLDLRKYRAQGTLVEWQDNVLVLCAGNSRLMFAVMCAFAGPLLGILGISGFGFQLRGISSIGKTITLIVAGSVWGCRVGVSSHNGFLVTWATTPEGVEPYGRTHNDALLLLDDTRKAGHDREIGKLLPTFLMRLADGLPKNRLLPIGTGDDWRLVYLGSSNLSLAEIFAAAGLEFDDAYRVRFPDIPGDAGCGFGAFENIHGRKDAATFAKELHAKACTYFGTASGAFLERLAADRRDRRAWLVSGLQQAITRYRELAPGGSAADGRIADHFAVVYAAAILARHYGILPWSREEIAWAVLTCHRAHLAEFAADRVALDPLAAVRGYISDNLSQFRPVPDPTITDQEFRTGLGFIYQPRPGTTEYAISPPVFEQQFGHFNLRRVLSVLDAAHLLVRTGDKSVSKVPVRSTATDGRKWAYRVRSVILAPDEAGNS